MAAKRLWMVRSSIEIFGSVSSHQGVIGNAHCTWPKSPEQRPNSLFSFLDLTFWDLGLGLWIVTGACQFNTKLNLVVFETLK